MKKITLLIAVLSMTLMSQLDAQTPCVNFSALTEDQIDLSEYLKSYGTGRKQRSNFAKFIGVGDPVTPLRRDSIVINMKAILQLMNMITAPCPLDIRATQVIFGLNGTAVVLFFRPIWLATTSTSTSGKIQYNNIPPDSSPIYKIDPLTGLFVPINDADKTLISNYQQHIVIKHTSLSGFSARVINTGTWHDDSEMVIFSFQEIFEMYHRTYPCNADGNNVYDQNIFFYNGIAPYFDDIWDKRRRKHTLFITTGDVRFDSANQSAVIANLAHLCPPSCNPVYEITSTITCH